MRNKLIELLKDAPKNLAVLSFETLADHLIANGVTIPQWIPVSERLPRIGETVIVADANNDLVNARHIGYGRLNTLGWACCYVNHKPAEPIDTYTHWMPLPTAPKEEEV